MKLTARILLMLALLCGVPANADEIYDWSNSAANNNEAPPDGFPENMNYQDVNDAARELMAVVRRHIDAIDGTNTTGGTQPAYTLTSGQSLSSGAAGRIHIWTAHATSTGNVTLNVDSAGAKNVEDAGGTQLGSGAIVSGGVYATIETSTEHRVIGALSAPAVVGPASSTDNTVVRFDGTGGGSLQGSGVTIDDSDNISGAGTIGSGAITSTGAVEGTSLVSSGAITAAGAITGATTVDVGNADTTLSRASAGDVNIEGNIVYRAGGTDVPVTDGGTGRSSATAYGVLTGGTTSTGAHQSVSGVGTSGQVLTSNGASNLPTWQSGPVSTIAAGALSSQATLDIDLSGGADMYEIDLINIDSVTAGAELYARFSQSSTFLSGLSDYAWAYTRATADANDVSDSRLEVTIDADLATFTFRVFRPAASSFVKTMTWWGTKNVSNTHQTINGGGELIANTDPVDGLRFFYSSGNISSGYYAVRAYDFGD